MIRRSVALVMVFACAAQAEVGMPASPVSTRAALLLDRREAATEEVAHALLGLADAFECADAAAAKACLSEPFAADRLPGPVGASAEIRPGYRRTVLAKAGAPLTDPGAWAGEMTGWLKAFARVEDARFEVLEADPNPDGMESAAVLRLRVQGVLPDGGRRALTARLTARLRFRGDRWTVGGLTLDAGEILDCARPPFVEVAVPAGLSKLTRPAPGEDFTFDWQGACAIDFDGDGWMDLFVPSRPVNHLYHNKRDGTFEDVAREWGVDVPAGGAGAIALDYDNDGHDDLFVCAASGPIRLFKNDGKRFTEVGKRAGVDKVMNATAAAAADYDGDGLVDVFVACYKPATEIGPNSWHRVTNGGPSLLFHNKGDGTFEEVAAKAGVAEPHFSFAASWADYDGDGRPDLAVANDYGDKSLYHNLGGGKFEEVAGKLGVLDTGNGMGVDWGDADGDGRLDLFTANMTSFVGDRVMKQLLVGQPAGDTARVTQLLRGNGLFRFDGQRFQDIRSEAGIADAGWAWGGGFLDVDSDGWLDLFVTNGMITGHSRADTDHIYWTHVAASSLPVPRALSELPSSQAYVERHHGQVLRGGWSFAGHQRDHLFLNAGAARFVDVSPVSGCDGPGDGRSAVFADFDNDGRTDIFVHEAQGRRHSLYANCAPAPVRFVSLTLEGVKSNRAAIGAEVRASLTGGAAPRTLLRTVSAGSGYASSGDRRVLIPVPAGETLGPIEIRWPGGAVQKLAALPAGSFFTVREGAEPVARDVKPARLGAPGGERPLTAGAGGMLGAGDPCPDPRAELIPHWRGPTMRLAGHPNVLVFLDMSSKEAAPELLAMEKAAEDPGRASNGEPPPGIVGLLLGDVPAGLTSGVPLAQVKSGVVASLFGRTPVKLPTAVLVDPDGQIVATRSGAGCCAAILAAMPKR